MTLIRLSSLSADMVTSILMSPLHKGLSLYARKSDITLNGLKVMLVRLLCA